MQPACSLLLLFVSLSLSLVLDGAQVCLPMVAIHYHAGDIFVLASESSCQQKPIIVILSLKCRHCHCQCHSHSQCLLGLASQNVLSLARLLRLLFIDFKCNKRHCAAASIICTPSECWMQFNWTMLFGFVIVSIELQVPPPPCTLLLALRVQHVHYACTVGAVNLIHLWIRW